MINVLVYDEKINSASFYGGLLSKEGYLVHYAFTSHDAFVKLRKTKYQIILMELDSNILLTLDNLVVFKEECPNALLILSGIKPRLDRSIQWKCLMQYCDVWIEDSPFGFKMLFEAVKTKMPSETDGIYKIFA